ncbi:MAG: hypothetical protein ACFFAE_07130 [Candidatus Hodarchaeota archaeon]
MLENKRLVQVTLYVSKISGPVMIEKGCKDGHCHSLVVSERHAGTPTSFYSIKTQEIINNTKKYCEKRGLLLEIKIISGIINRMKYLVSKGILKTPALEITHKRENFKFKPSYPFDANKFTEYLNKITLKQA